MPDFWFPTRRWRRRCLALAWLFFVVPALATTPESPDDARWRAQSEVLFTHHSEPVVWGTNAIVQDGRGFLWAGTQTGLVRWDGYRFRNFTADPQTPGSLPDSYIVSLYEDGRGRLWVGSGSGGLARHEAADDSFVVYKAGPGGVSGHGVTAITGDGGGGLWVGTSAGLDHVDADDVVHAATPADTAARALPEGGVQALLLDRGGTLWAGTEHGLFRRTPGAPAFAAVPLPLPDGKTTASVTKMFQQQSGRLWVGTRGGGAFVIDAPTSAPRAVHEQGPQAALATDTVLSIVETVPGEVWLATYGGGILVVDAGGETRRLRRHPGTATSLNDDDVLSLFRDRSGLVWVATDTALSQHDPQQRAVLSLLGGTGRNDGLRSLHIPSLLSRPDGRVWLGQSAGGIDIVDPWLGRVGQLEPDAAHPEAALPKARVLGMVASPDGEVYIGTRAGLYIGDAQGRRVRRVTVPQRDPHATVWSLCLDAGILWMGGQDGLWAIDMSVPQRPRVLRHDSARQVGGARVVAIVRGTGRSLWVGTDVGLVHVDLVSGALDVIPNDAADAQRMAPGYVSSLHLDRRGRLWISSYGHGVLLMQGQAADGSLRFRRLGLRDGLPHLGTNKLLEDRHGDLWVSTDDGLAVIDADTLTARALQRPQGVGILTYWTNSGDVTPAGELLFGGQGGVSVVRPERLVPWTYRPPVVVTEARMGATPLPSGRFGSAARPAARLDVPSDVRGLWVEFAALDFSAPERNRYAHRLQGFDADWIPTESTRRLASYTNLPPGDYTLELRGSNRDGAWSDALALPIRVLPAWYQTMWFRGLAAVAVLGVVGALVQARTLYLRQRQRELEALVAERTAELQRRGEELRTSQRQLEKIAYADALTGLPNRRLFTDELRHNVVQAQRGGNPFVLLLIDLDGFKRVNDTLGHDAGDALLVATAARLTLAVREADRVARMGGDEFAVLLTQAPSRDDVDSVCRRITAGLGEPLGFGGNTLRVSASIGVARCPAHAAEPDRLYKAADVALYEAKRAGRNTWRWFGEAANAAGPGGASDAASTGAVPGPEKTDRPSGALT